MITRIEISGFKSFTDFSVELAPLTVIAGANASGKSNLLDALRVLKGLAQGRSLNEAISKRGSGYDLFSKYDKDTIAPKLRICVDLLLPRQVFYKRAKKQLTGTRMRYEITIKRPSLDDAGYFEIDEENLRFIKESEDDYLVNVQDQTAAASYFIYAPDDSKPVIDYNIAQYRVHVGDHIDLDDNRELLTEAILGNSDSESDLHAVAVKELLSNLIPVDLIDPANFSSTGQHTATSNGNSGSILTRLGTLKKNHPEDLNYLSLRVRQIANNITGIDVLTDEFGRSSVTATDERGARFLAESLSEGTLRVLALATFLMNENPDQTLLLEEPENGVDPRVLGKMLELLLDLISDFSHPGEGLCQVICTTHSAQFLELVLELEDSKNVTALLTTKVTATGGKYRSVGGIHTTRMYKIYPEKALTDAKDPTARVTHKLAKQYLLGPLPYKELTNA